MNKLIKFSLVPFFFIFVFSFSHEVHALTFSPVRFELQANPGQALEKEITLTNETDAPITLFSSYSNFEASGEGGTPSFVESKEGLAGWMNVQTSITIEPKESVTVPYQIIVPQGAEPGGYFAGVHFTTTPPAVGELGGQVAIGAKTGPLVLLTVNGDVKEAGGIVEFDTVEKKKLYTSLPISFYYRFRNDGRDRIKPVGDIHIKNILGISNRSVDANKVEGNILPNSTRRFDVEWSGRGRNASSVELTEKLSFFESARYQWNNFAFGRYTSELSLSFGQKDGHASKKIVLWVVPWQLLLILCIIIVIISVIFRKIIRHYNNYIIGQATHALEDMEKRRIKTEKREAPVKEETLNLRPLKNSKKKN